MKEQQSHQGPEADGWKVWVREHVSGMRLESSRIRQDYWKWYGLEAETTVLRTQMDLYTFRNTRAEIDKHQYAYR